MSSEFSLIARHFVRRTPSAVLGPGDDCALLHASPDCELAVTTDMLVSGTHFFADTEPEALGWKTLAVNLSDLAAMGATPRWALLAGALPDANEAWLAAFAKGLFACADAHQTELVGGDLTRGPLTLCVTAIGETPSGTALRRDGACAGDDLWISGRPGCAALGLMLARDPQALGTSLSDADAADFLQALHRPQPRLSLGLALRGLASSTIDVSDGLMADLGHILDRSGCAAVLEEALLPPLPAGVEPTLARRCQLAGGDDYELVFTAAASTRDVLTALGDQLGVRLTRIGRICEAVNPASDRLQLVDASGAPINCPRQGYDHFANASTC